ncbi:MAG: M48 family metallopeptidase [Rhodocyclaceae bacterium]|nr:M48 family metallopeptidase [Rhodocyclaceae bacterium]
MDEKALTASFLFALALTTLLRLALAVRQQRHVLAHRENPPAAFAAIITLDAHRKAADYTAAKLRVGYAELATNVVVLLALTLAGGLDRIALFWRDLIPSGGIGYGLALCASVTALLSLIDLPFAFYRTFVIEERFGFNKTTPKLFFADLVRQALLIVVLGTPLLALILWLIEVSGDAWWWQAWLAWLAFNVLLLWLYPTVIAPLFNRFSPLPEGELKTRVQALLARCQLGQLPLFVMDGSRRTAHGNAYFTGFGRAKRIVFYDNVINRLAPAETEAVLAHEIGHYRLRHLAQRLVLTALSSFVLLMLVSWLVDTDGFYRGLGVIQTQPAELGVGGKAIGLILFALIEPVFFFPFTPLFSAFSRYHEFAADAFAARHSEREALISALLKLYRDNAATLTPDPLYSLFYASHPPAVERIAHLRALPVPV